MRDAMAERRQVKILTRVGGIAILALLGTLPCGEAMAQTTRTAMYLQAFRAP